MLVRTLRGFSPKLLKHNPASFSHNKHPNVDFHWILFSNKHDFRKMPFSKEHNFWSQKFCRVLDTDCSFLQFFLILYLSSTLFPHTFPSISHDSAWQFNREFGSNFNPLKFSSHLTELWSSSSSRAIWLYWHLEANQVAHTTLLSHLRNLNKGSTTCVASLKKM